MKTLKEKIEVMQAAERGEPIEVTFCGESGKFIPIKNPDFNWEDNDYRVAPPSPAVKEIWVNVYPSGAMIGHTTKRSALAKRSVSGITARYILAT